MPRDRVAVRRRLQQAALELYGKRGFDDTTTSEIAARAGVTERTFFRHFADKRDVLFDGESTLRDVLVGSIATAPRSLGPFEAIVRAFVSAEQMFIDGRPIAEARQAVIASVPALRERALAKNQFLTDALAAALRERGVGDRLATLAAQTGMAVFSYAAKLWADDPSNALEKHIHAASNALRSLSTTRTRQAVDRKKRGNVAPRARV